MYAPPHSRACFTAVSFDVFSVSFYGSVFLVFSFPSHNARLGKRAEKIGLKFQHFHNSASNREWSESIKSDFRELKVAPKWIKRRYRSVDVFKVQFSGRIRFMTAVAMC